MGLVGERERETEKGRTEGGWGLMAPTVLLPSLHGLMGPDHHHDSGIVTVHTRSFSDHFPVFGVLGGFHGREWISFLSFWAIYCVLGFQGVGVGTRIGLG